MRITTDARIKIAVQKSGRLTEHSLELLVRCGLSYSRGKDQLICYGENMPVDVLLVRDDDIPRLVQEDICDLGIVGLNIIEERRLELLEQRRDGAVQRDRPARLRPVPACRSVCRRACRSAAPNRCTASGSRRRYPRILREYLARHGVEAQIVTFSGAVEIAPSLGKADLICDLVSSGVDVARAPALRGRDDSREPRGADPDAETLIGEKAEWLQRLLQRVQGVLQVKESKYIMLHAPRSALKEITALLPGSEAPTIIPLEGRDDKVAVHAVCRENVFWETLEQLKEAGASSMLVLPVEKMLS